MLVQLPVVPKPLLKNPVQVIGCKVEIASMNNNVGWLNQGWQTGIGKAALLPSFCRVTVYQKVKDKGRNRNKTEAHKPKCTIGLRWCRPQNILWATG
jgi:hypothetical protein